MANKSVEIFKLDNGMMVPSMDGRLFCSRRDPVKESEAWYQSHRMAMAGASKILILGLGAGLHLMNFDPSQEVFVLELNQDLIRIFEQRDLPMKPRVQFLPEDTDTEASVFEFRPAWLGNEVRYQEISRRLRHADSTSLQSAAEKKDLLMLAEVLKTSPWPGNVELTVKEITQLFPLENQTQEAKIWRALRELVA